MDTFQEVESDCFWEATETSTTWNTRPTRRKILRRRERSSGFSSNDTNSHSNWCHRLTWTLNYDMNRNKCQQYFFCMSMRYKTDTNLFICQLDNPGQEEEHKRGPRFTMTLRFERYVILESLFAQLSQLVRHTTPLGLPALVVVHPEEYPHGTS